MSVDTADAGEHVVDAPPATGTLRRTIALNQGWRFVRKDVPEARGAGFDDGTWSTVSLPHTWNALDGQDGNDDYYRGVGWYRTHVSVPADEAGRRLYVEFDGANILAVVYVNGVRLGEHRGGFARFRFDATDAIEVGADNVIAVEVSNAASLSKTIPPVSADFTFFGGLYREARIVSVNPIHLDLDHFGSSGVSGTTNRVSKQSADVAVRASVTNAGATMKSTSVVVRVLTADGTTVRAAKTDVSVAASSTKDVTVNLTVAHPHLWNGLADPYLYRLRVDLEDGAKFVDDVVEPLGFRFFSFAVDEGFTLNGNRLRLDGINKHQDRLNEGWAVSHADLDEDMAILRDLGANALRLAHYQHAQYFYDLCDRNGLLVWAEAPIVDSVAEGKPFAENAEQQLVELIRQNANHPSIVMWSLGNEIANAAQAVPLLTDLAARAHREDPSRPTVLATNKAPDDPLTSVVDLIGVNRYFGWYGGTSAEFASDLDGAHRVAVRPLAVSEYGAGAGITIHSRNPVKMDHSEEYQSLFHEVHWKAISARPFVWGSFVWNLFDFAVDGRKEGETPGRNDKGLVTYDRKTKKDAFYFYKANWSSDPFVYITERRWTSRPAGTYDVKVYSNGEEVKLVANGEPSSARSARDHVFVFEHVTLKTGPNALEASTVVSGKTVTDAVRVTGT